MSRPVSRCLGSLALGLTVVMSASVHATPPGIDAEASEHSITGVKTPRFGGHGLAPGTVIASEPLPVDLWLPFTGHAHRLHYLSKGLFGSSTVVSGAMFVPEGPAPAGGWPIVSWAHGTVGVADVCAPSTAGRSARDITYLSAWLQAGYAVAATDYRGLGTIGRHPYLDGTSAARDVIDMVRAARHVDPSLSESWLAVGQSQGAHAALFTASIATDYAPELDFRGSIATAPPTQWRMTITETDATNPGRPANPNAMEILAGLETVHPFTFKAADYLTHAGRKIYRDALRDECFSARAARVANMLSGELYKFDAAAQETLIRFLELEDVPIHAYDRPVYIAQGTADRIVYPPATQVTADRLRAAGTDSTLAVYVGADHNGVLAAALPDLLAWAANALNAPPK